MNITIPARPVNQRIKSQLLKNIFIIAAVRHILTRI